jgi:hypothetical protein
MKLVRWVAAGLVLGAGAAFAAELMRPRSRVRGSSGYTPPPPSRDNRVVLPDASPILQPILPTTFPPPAARRV